MSSFPSHVFQGGPWDGVERLGRLRPDAPQPSDPDAGRMSSVATLPIAAFGGRYERITPDGAVCDRYEWLPDVDTEDAA
jgi:hypothetical protein